MNKNIMLVFFGIFFITSCVNSSLKPDVVSRSDAQKQQYVVFGTISDVSVIWISIKKIENLKTKFINWILLIPKFQKIINSLLFSYLKVT